MVGLSHLDSLSTVRSIPRPGLLQSLQIDHLNLRELAARDSFKLLVHLEDLVVSPDMLSFSQHAEEILDLPSAQRPVSGIN